MHGLAVRRSLIGHPARRRVALARAVAARHRHRAAGDRRGAGPRLGLARCGPGRAPARRAVRASPRRSPRRPRRAPAKLWPLTSASQCGSAATMPPACTENAPAPTRGLTHTIRWASRARRSISRPTSAGSPRSQPSERITTTAPRAMPRRPWRSLNVLQRVADPGAARPVRRGGGGALDGALRVARGRARGSGASGAWRTRTPRRSARCRRRRSGTAGRRGRRAPSSRRCRTAARAGGGRRGAGGGRGGSGRRRVRRLAAQRAAQVDVLAVAALLVAARAPQRRGQLQARHQPVELRELVRLERVEALAPRAAPRRWPAPAAPRPRAPSSSLAVAGAAGAPARSRPPSPASTVACAARGLVVGRRGDASARPSRSKLVAGARPPKTAREDARRRPATCAGSETSTARAVQYSRRRATGRTSASARAKSAERAGRDRHAGVVQAPAERARRAAAGRARSSRRRRRGASVTAAHELLEAGRAHHLLVLAVLEHRAERAVDRARRRAARRRAGSSARQPVDRLGDARRLLHVARRACARRRRPPARPASARRPGPGGGRSRPRAAASGSRSSGRGSGA